jgi:hypothetical protein
MLQPSPTVVTTPWPIPGDVPALLAIVQAQARTIADQEALIDDYQSLLSDAQSTPSPIATATATASAASLAVIGTVGSIFINSLVQGNGVPAGTTILAQQSGTPGKDGTYTTSQVTTASADALTFTPGASATGTGSAGNTLTVTGVSGVIEDGATIAGIGVPNDTIILFQKSGTLGGNGVYATDQQITGTGVVMTFTPVVGVGSWPTVRDADTLNAILLAQTSVIKTQTSLLQQYQDLLNTSQVAVPPTGP